MLCPGTRTALDAWRSATRAEDYVALIELRTNARDYAKDVRRWTAACEIIERHLEACLLATDALIASTGRFDDRAELTPRREALLRALSVLEGVCEEAGPSEEARGLGF